MNFFTKKKKCHVCGSPIEELFDGKEYCEACDEKDRKENRNKYVNNESEDKPNKLHEYSICCSGTMVANIPITGQYIPTTFQTSGQI